MLQQLKFALALSSGLLFALAVSAQESRDEPAGVTLPGAEGPRPDPQVETGNGRGSTHVAAPDAEELTRLLNEFLAGASVNDLDAHRRFWADDLIYTSSTGERFGKADIVERNTVPDDPTEAEERELVYTAEDVRIQQYGDTAVVAFRLVATQAKPPQILNYFNTGTFLKRDGSWQVVAWQATRIPEAD